MYVYIFKMYVCMYIFIFKMPREKGTIGNKATLGAPTPWSRHKHRKSSATMRSARQWCRRQKQRWGVKKK